MKKVFTKRYFLTAGECTPQREMPLPLLMSRLIEIATLHANSWGAGYAFLIERGEAWVLSRVTIEMTAFPKINEEYEITTWIEDYNRHFSLRNMRINDKDGNVLGYARTVWVVINLNTREGVDITSMSFIRENVCDLPCPIAPQGRLRLQNATRQAEHRITFTDCDLNRHVNTVRYLELLINQFELEKYDSQMVSRLEIAFIKETRYGELAVVSVDDTNPDDCTLSIDAEGTTRCRARMIFAKRN